ncbi:Uncharacterised protein [Mycobacteroides abscessus subsp. abscessus]|nr:Uncharacterised protein [Mycobacteroides abscessus subsp. abscessus]
MISACSTACTFDEPEDGADMARREMRRSLPRRSGSISGRLRPKNGQAPWLAGSSWTQAMSVAFG